MDLAPEFGTLKPRLMELSFLITLNEMNILHIFNPIVPKKSISNVTK
jgi:hypothetical protein